MEALNYRSGLQLHTASLRGMIHTATGQLVAAPSLSGDVLEDICTLQAHCTDCEAKLASTAPPSEFAAGLNTGSTRQDQRLSPGNPSTAGALPSSGAKSSTGKKMTLTEQVLAAKGVATIAEANEKHINDIASIVRAESQQEDKTNDGKDKDGKKGDDDGNKKDDGKQGDDGGEKKGDGSGAKTNMTAQILKARGVKTLAELQALPLRDSRD